MQNAFERSEMLWGKDAQNKLKTAHVAVFGVGGVGGHALECLVRAGVGEISIIDNDTIANSNINRQIIATSQNIGTLKVDAAKSRVLQINPECKVNAISLFYLPENAHEIELGNFDYIIDAIDTVSAKIELITRAHDSNVKIISSMGCGNKLDPSAFSVTDLFKTDTDPLARVLRRELKKKGIKKLKVVFSKEPAIKPIANLNETISEKAIDCQSKDEDIQQDKINNNEKTASKRFPASVSFVPGVCGMIMAGEVIKDITGLTNN